MTKFVKIKNAEIEFPIKKNSLRIKGDITPKDLLKTNQEIFMRFLTNDKFEIYKCILDPPDILDCDTSNHPINTTIKDIHLSTSINSSIFFFIELNNWKNNTIAIQIPKPLKKEEIKADDPAYFIEDNILIATEEKNSAKKNAKIQIIKFANFNRTLKHNISFNTYIYFFGRKVVQDIFLRLRIAYSKKLRYLEESEESVPCKCVINNMTKVGKETNGDNIDYKCEASTIGDTSKIINVTLNNDVDMRISNEKGGYESIHFKDINFNGESAEESKNLIKIENITKIGTLDDTEVELPIQKNLFRIKGKLNPINLLEENTIIPISFLVEKKIQKIYQCKAIQISPQCILQCNTSNNPINTTVKDMHLGVSKNSKISLIIKMKNWENDKTLIETPNEVKANDDSYIIDKNTPYAQGKKNNSNKKAKLQFIKFANFSLVNKNGILFKTYMYFKDIKIVEEIIFRLRIAYTSRLRHLEETAESTPCKCSIINKTKIGKIENNDYILYNCKADTMRDPTKIYKITLNNDIDMMISKEKGGYDTINFKEINFNGESAKDSNNLGNIGNIKKSGSLDNAKIDLPLQQNYFIIRGTLNPNDLLKKKDKIPISFLVNDKNEKIQKTYQCEVKSINPECIFQCDIINIPINTTVKDMNLGVSENSDILLVIKMKNPEDGTIVDSAQKYNIFKKNKSGLSKGAIAGIIIACMVVLICVSILSFVILKPKNNPINPPIYNSSYATGVDKSNENINK